MDGTTYINNCTVALHEKSIERIFDFSVYGHFFFFFFSPNDHQKQYFHEWQATDFHERNTSICTVVESERKIYVTRSEILVLVEVRRHHVET